MLGITYLSGSEIEYEFKLSEYVSAERLVLCDRRIERPLPWRTDVLGGSKRVVISISLLSFFLSAGVNPNL